MVNYQRLRTSPIQAYCLHTTCMLPVGEAASWNALLTVSSDAPAPKSTPPYAQLAWRWFLQNRLRLSSPSSVLRPSTLSPINSELCLAEPHSCQPFQYTPQYVALLAPAMTSPAYFQSARSVCSLSAPQSASYVYQKTRVAYHQTLAASQVFPDSPLDTILFMSLMRWQKNSHTHGKSTHSLGHLNRHQTQQELNGVCATICVTIFYPMDRLVSNHAVSYPMLQLSIMWLTLYTYQF